MRDATAVRWCADCYASEKDKTKKKKLPAYARTAFIAVMEEKWEYLKCYNKTTEFGDVWMHKYCYYQPLEYWEGRGDWNEREKQ